MRRWSVGALIVLLAASVSAAVFERYLSPDRPLDRAILNYLALERAGKATSWDLGDLGVLLLEKGFPVDAERYLRKALDLDKHDFEAAYRLGLVLQRQGRDREAVKYYRRALAERPGHGYARFMLALAEERSGRRDAAIRDYAKAYRFAPELADPTKNPLVLDSDLQTEAELTRYDALARASTLKVTSIDPNAVRRMMEAIPGKPPENAPPPAAPAPPPAPRVQAPLATATPTHATPVVAPHATPVVAPPATPAAPPAVRIPPGFPQPRPTRTPAATQ